ncbi:cbb3-type cytochrome c oxidase subunit I [Halobacteriales archaeon Cl-PHB]
MFPWVAVVVVAACLVLGLTAWRRWRQGDAGGPPAADGGTAHKEAHGRALPSGLLRVFTTVNHRDVGLLYLGFALVAGLWGATDAMMMRTELLTASTAVWDAETYGALFTMHGVTMLFFFVTPAFTGLGNYLLPLLIGAEDMAFPRINAIAFWLLPPALLLARAGLVTDVVGKALAPLGLPVQGLLELAPPNLGWTMYAPMSAQVPNPQVNLLLLGLHLSGIATTLAAINFIVTIVTERAEDVSWANLDIFSWSMLTTSGIILFAFPLLGSALVMLLLDRVVDTVFFAPQAGGGPLLWQHLFWFFGHPEVYILVLPAFGLLSFLLPKFSGPRLFGFRFIVYSTLAIGVLSFGVWAHHMFSTGMDPRLQVSFMAVSLAIAVPTAVKVFNWITTMYNGSVRLRAPMVFALGAIASLIVGGITGVFLASIPIDRWLHGTYYVVGHFHLIVGPVIASMTFAASYYWFPLITRRMYDSRLAMVHAALFIPGALIAFDALLIIGFGGQPRRSVNYAPQWVDLQRVASAGSFMMGAGATVWLYNLVQSYRIGPKLADGDPWDLAETGQLTKEWEWLDERLGTDEMDD